jgi:hypothetical protein
MQTTILIQEGRTQLVLKPESEHEKEVLNVLRKMPNTHSDNFYDCEGGWTRRSGIGMYDTEKDKDLVIVFDNKEDETN